MGLAFPLSVLLTPPPTPPPHPPFSCWLPFHSRLKHHSDYSSVVETIHITLGITHTKFIVLIPKVSSFVSNVIFQSFRFAVISGFINVREPHEQLGDRVQPQILIPFLAILSFLFFSHISFASCLPILLFLSHSIFIYPLHTHRE